jgi:quercetin dioxygenase-like cupin family protein
MIHDALSTRKNIEYPDSATKVHLPATIHADGSDTVFIEVAGFHGHFVNSKSKKIYKIAGGELKFIVNGKEIQAAQGDIVGIFINEKHAIQGKGCFFLTCSPAYDANTEVRYDS